MIAPRLAYVAVVVRDVDAVSASLESGFGLRRTHCDLGDTVRSAPVFAIGEAELALFRADDPFVGGEERTGVHHIALGCEDPTASLVEASAKGFDVAGTTPEPGLGGGKSEPAGRVAPGRTRAPLDGSSSPGGGACTTSP